MTSRAWFVSVLGGLLVVGLAGCDSHPADPVKPGVAVQSVAVPARVPESSPADAVGGACQLLDFYAVEALLGLPFDVAAAAQRDDTLTCVLQRSGTNYPDLMLSVSITTATVAMFKSSVVPKGSTELPGLGQVAYVLVTAPTTTDPAQPGTTVEVGWLARTAYLMVVRYRLAADATAEQVEQVKIRLPELARFLDPV